jgi:hypothetical protein
MRRRRGEDEVTKGVVGSGEGGEEEPREASGGGALPPRR